MLLHFTLLLDSGAPILTPIHEHLLSLLRKTLWMLNPAHKASAPPIALLVQQSVLGLHPYVSGDSTQVTMNTPAWQPGQKGCFHWSNPSHTSPERPSTPQDHSVPQAASLQSAWSLGLYKHYFLMRTIVGILEMPGNKTLHSSPGAQPGVGVLQTSQTGL